ncbi:MAG: hypothetical protein M3Q33_14885 [Acidobacteriota bacterium]|nr:hypothetical protein [Acidobacteriota bacterium]
MSFSWHCPRIQKTNNFYNNFSYKALAPKVTTPFAIANGRLQNTDIFNANGWVFYVSDRRGDTDFDGEYDMEDIYGNNDGILQAGEDINNSGSLQTNYINEAVRYSGAGNFISSAAAATFEHPYYRRGVRLING